MERFDSQFTQSGRQHCHIAVVNFSFRQWNSQFYHLISCSQKHDSRLTVNRHFRHSHSGQNCCLHISDMCSFFQKCSSLFKILSCEAIITPSLLFAVNFYRIFAIIGILLINTAIAAIGYCSTCHNAHCLSLLDFSFRILSCINLFHDFQPHRMLFSGTCKILYLTRIAIYRRAVKRRIVKPCHHILRQDSSPCFIQFCFFCLVYYRRMLQNLFHCLFYTDSLHALIPPLVYYIFYSLFNTFITTGSIDGYIIAIL